MNYIKTYQNKIIISKDKTLKIYKTTFNEYINKILIKSLTTMNGRIDAVKDKYHIYKLVPIYLNKEICLVPLFNLNNETNIYINVNKVKKVIDYIDYSLIVFIDLEEIYIKVKANTLKKKIRKALNIMI